MTIDGIDRALIGLIKRALQGDERHQYTMSEMERLNPERYKILLQIAEEELENEKATDV